MDHSRQDFTVLLRNSTWGGDRRQRGGVEKHWALVSGFVFHRGVGQQPQNWFLFILGQRK